VKAEGYELKLEVDPYTVACPICERAAGEVCRNIYGPGDKVFPHPARVDVVRAELAGKAAQP
jgi:hypothetical protein